MKSIREIATEKVKGESRFDEILRFAITGGIATVLQYGIYVVFVDAVGVKAVPSQLISYVLSFIANFFLSAYFTFRAKPTGGRGLGFILSHLVNMGLQTGLVAIFKGIVGSTLALLPAMAICIPVNYIMVRTVFKSKVFMPASQRKALKEKAAGDAETPETTDTI